MDVHVLAPDFGPVADGVTSTMVHRPLEAVDVARRDPAAACPGGRAEARRHPPALVHGGARRPAARRRCHPTSTPRSSTSRMPGPSSCIADQLRPRLVAAAERRAVRRTDVLVTNCQDEIDQGARQGSCCPPSLSGVAVDAGALPPDERSGAGPAACRARPRRRPGPGLRRPARLAEGAGPAGRGVGEGCHFPTTDPRPRRPGRRGRHSRPLRRASGAGRSGGRASSGRAPVDVGGRRLGAPSRYETVAIVVAEAMACGVPVVATAVNGARETLLDPPGEPLRRGRAARRHGRPAPRGRATPRRRRRCEPRRRRSAGSAPRTGSARAGRAAAGERLPGRPSTIDDRRRSTHDRPDGADLPGRGSGPVAGPPDSSKGCGPTRRSSSPTPRSRTTSRSTAHAVDFTGPGTRTRSTGWRCTDRDAYLALYPQGSDYPACGDGSVSTMYYHEHAIPEVLRDEPGHAARRAAARAGRPRPLELPVHAGPRASSRSRTSSTRCAPRRSARRANWHHLWHYTAHEPVRRRGRGAARRRCPGSRSASGSTTTWSVTTKARVAQVLRFLGCPEQEGEAAGVPRVNISGTPRAAAAAEALSWATRHETRAHGREASTSYRMRERVRRRCLRRRRSRPRRASSSSPRLRRGPGTAARVLDRIGGDATGLAGRASPDGTSSEDPAAAQPPQRPGRRDGGARPRGRAAVATAGHEVEQLTLAGRRGARVCPLRAGAKAIWNARDRRERRDGGSQTFRPDVVHVHTPFPLMSPAVFRAAHTAGRSRRDDAAQLPLLLRRRHLRPRRRDLRGLRRARSSSCPGSGTAATTTAGRRSAALDPQPGAAPGARARSSKCVSPASSRSPTSRGGC